ncbi:hypothetical protein pb186bvf_019884 [Paramecium bursaria]
MQETNSQQSEQEKYWQKPFNQQDYRFRINSSQQPKNLERELIDPSIKIKEEQMKYSQRKARIYEESFIKQKKSFQANNIKNLDILQTFDCRNCSNNNLDIDIELYQLNLIDKTKQPIQMKKLEQVQQSQAKQQNSNAQILNQQEFINSINNNIRQIQDFQEIQFNKMIDQMNNLEIAENLNQQYLIDINNRQLQQQQSRPSSQMEEADQFNQINSEKNHKKQQSNIINSQTSRQQYNNQDQQYVKEENNIEYGYEQYQQQQGQGSKKQKPINVIPESKQKQLPETAQHQQSFDKEIQQQIILSQLLNKNRLLPINQQKNMKQILEEVQKQWDQFLNQNSVNQMLKEQSNQLKDTRGHDKQNKELIKRKQVQKDYEEIEKSQESNNFYEEQINENSSDDQQFTVKQNSRGERKQILVQKTKPDSNNKNLNKRSKFTQRKQSSQIQEQSYNALDFNNLDQFDFQNNQGLNKCKNLFQLHILTFQDITLVQKYYFNRFHLELQQFFVSYVKQNDIIILLIKISSQLQISLQQLKDNFGEAYIYPGILNDSIFRQFLKLKFDNILVNRQTIYDIQNEYKIQNIQSEADQYRLNGFGLLIKYIQVDDFQDFLDSFEDCYFISYIRYAQKADKAIMVYLEQEQIIYIFSYQKKGFNSICRDVFYDQRLEYIQTLEAECEMVNGIKLLQGLCEGKKTQWLPFDVKFEKEQVFNNYKLNFAAYQLNYYHVDNDYSEINRIKITIITSIKEKKHIGMNIIKYKDKLKQVYIINIIEKILKQNYFNNSMYIIEHLNLYQYENCLQFISVQQQQSLLMRGLNKKELKDCLLNIYNLFMTYSSSLLPLSYYKNQSDLKKHNSQIQQEYLNRLSTARKKSYAPIKKQNQLQYYISQLKSQFLYNLSKYLITSYHSIVFFIQYKTCFTNIFFYYRITILFQIGFIFIQKLYNIIITSQYIPIISPFKSIGNHRFIRIPQSQIYSNSKFCKPQQLYLSIQSPNSYQALQMLIINHLNQLLQNIQAIGLQIFR